MTKVYTLADFAERIRKHKKERENKIIEEILAKNARLESRGYYLANSKLKRQLRAEANTIPLKAFTSRP